MKATVASIAPVQAAAESRYIPGVAGGAAYTHMSERKFAALVADGKVKAIRHGGKRLLFDRLDLDAYLQSCKS